MTRCRVAIRFETLTTRCHFNEGHYGVHTGKGLAAFDYQRLTWLPGDRREFVSDRPDEYAWEEADNASR